MTQVVAVGLGGAIGALLRWQLRRLGAGADVGSDVAAPHSALGTLAANLLGSFLLGLVVAAPVDPTVRTALGLGVAGGLTTFSTLVVQAAERPPRVALVVLGTTLVLGVACAWLGLQAGAAL